MSEPQSYQDAFPALAPAKTTTSSAWTAARSRPALRPSTVVEHVVIPVAEQSGDFGGASKTTQQIQSIRDRYRVVIDSSASDGNLTLMVSGSRDAVTKAKKDLLELLQTQVTMDVLVPREHHGSIIGKKGATLQGICNKFSVRIFMPKEAEESDKIVVKGTTANCKLAAKEILAISTEKAKRDRQVLAIPKAYHPLVAGFENSTIKQIEASTGARIHVPPPGNPKNEIVVSGDRDPVAVAVSQLTAIYNEKVQTCGELTAKIPKTQHRFVIGPGGSNLKEIFKTTGVVVEVPPPDEDSDCLILRGNKDKLVVALTGVYELANKVAVEVIPIPRWLHKHLIGKGGENMKKLKQEKPEVRIQFQESRDEVQIEGPPADVKIVQASLQALATQLQATMTFDTVPCDPRFHPHVIGQRGKTINEIKAKTGAHVIIPRDEDKLAVKSKDIRIEGTPEGVAAAKEILTALIARVANQTSVDIVVPQRLHSQVIGPGGSGLNALKEGCPTISVDFPSRSKNSDIIGVRGDKAEVATFERKLKARAKQIALENYTEDVHIFQQFHKAVIGKGGATIKALREETQTRINLPPADTDSDYITVIGLEKNVRAAAAKLLELQREMADIQEETLDIDRKYHKIIAGKQNGTVEGLMQDLGVQIILPHKGSTIKIRGPSDKVPTAVLMVKEFAVDVALNFQEVEVTVPQRFHPHLIGKNGARLTAICEETGVKRINIPKKSARSDTVVIVGTADNCAKAKLAIEKRVKELEAVVNKTVDLDPKFFGTLIKSRFANDLAQELGGVRIRFPPQAAEGEETSSTVEVIGALDDVDTAIERLKARVDVLERTVTEDFVTIAANIPSICGAKGVNIQEITKSCDVRLDLPPRSSSADDSKAEKVIKITGVPEACEAAKEALQALVPIEEVYPLEAKFHRFVIGAKGAGISEIQRTCNVRLEIPKGDAPADQIVIRGLKEDIEAAKAALQAKQPEYDEALAKNNEMVIEVPQKYHVRIIGRAGAEINALRKKHDVRLDLPKEGDSIKLTGYPANCQACADDIQAKVSAFMSEVEREVEIHHSIHNRIIGARGARLRELQKEFGVRINIPKEGDMIMVTGQEENVDNCAEHLYTLQEEHMDDIEDYIEMQRHMAPPPVPQQKAKAQPKKFEVTGGPWEFPSLGGDSTPAPAAAKPKGVWGQRQ
eukprot:m.352478 g.352478  ORF g.352478 m.352478 type:complete len:1183 (+) comp16533_c0_seq1:169-3717(+)